MRSAHDCSDGGLAVTLAECVFDSGGIGCMVDVPAAGSRLDATLFGESASRVVASVRQQDVATLMQLAAEHGVPARVVGTTGGPRITIGVDGRAALDCSIEEAHNTWATALERFFAGRAA
jgi:phosphoribosylformylglycinamidine synthase